MLETPRPKHILEKAREQERQYRWPEAAQSYLGVLGCVSTDDLSRRGELGEMLGHALYKAALQSDSWPVFQERMRQAIDAYEDAETSYQGIDNSVTEARLLRCDAMCKYLRSWDTVEPKNKKSLLDQSCNLSKKALQILEDLGESHEYAETFDVFSLGVMSRISLEWTVPARRDVIREAISFAEKATLQLSPSTDGERLARLYVRLAAFLEEIGSSYDVDQRYRYHQKAQDYWIRAKKLSESYALKEMANSIEREVEGLCGGRGSREALTIFSEALGHARITGDRLLLGRALDGLAYHTSWRALAVEDREEKLNLYKTSVALSEQANEEFSKISFTSLRGGVLWAHAPHAEHYWQLGVRYETDPRRKKIFLEKALQAVPDFLEKAHKSGSPEVIGTAHHVASKILASLAKLDFDPDRKESLLKEAESHRLKNIELAPTHRVLNYWESAVDEYGLSQIQFSLAQISTDSETKNKRLEEATGNMKAAIDHAIRHIDAGEGKHSASDYAHLAIWHERYGELLSNMYHSTNKTALLKEAAESFTHASEHFERSHQSSRVAESLWKRAQCFEALNEHLNSAEDFHYAARSYRHASSANRSLKRLFDDYASYMEAWAQIEMARHRHRERKFALSNRCYEKAVVFLRSTSKWNYLGTYYSAWAELERAQDVSIKEQNMEAARAFKESGALFKKAKLSLQRILPSLTAEDERKMVNRLIGTAAIRKEYILASVRLEEAKLFERTGDYSASFQKYGGASEILEKVSSRVEAEEDRLEVQAMIAIIKGYELMTRAETESLPDFYIRAAESFEKAIETSPDGNWSLVLRGHSHFCRALSAGARLVDSPDDALHQTAIEELDHARSCYLRARGLAAADCAEASKLLLEAYLLINKAKKEESPQEKSKVYHMVEKLLRVSADRYRRASQPARRTKVLELLSSVRKERKIIGSLLFDVSRSPSILKSIAPLQAFETHHELSAGVRNFEDANIYANVKLNVNNPQVGQDIDAQVDIANAGRETANLVKIEIVIPESFEVLEAAGSPRLEGKSFDLGNRKLSPLKTETFRLLLKPKAEGLFVLKSRTHYVDSTGSTKVHDSDYASVIVSPIAELLARAFAKDFKLERLPFEDSGWRTMTNIAASLKLPRSQVYGDLKSGHSFARPLEKLLNAGVIEYRRFPKQRGRGGTVTKLRLCYETDAAKSVVEKLSEGISLMR